MAGSQVRSPARSFAVLNASSAAGHFQSAGRRACSAGLRPRGGGKPAGGGAGFGYLPGEDEAANDGGAEPG
jgi:hypothetical protein